MTKKKYVILGVTEMAVFAICMIVFPYFRKTADSETTKKVLNLLTLGSAVIGCIGMGTLQKAYDLRELQEHQEEKENSEKC